MTHDPQYADSWPAANEAGTHDPFCYFNRDNGEFDFMAGRCARCQLIAKVRADQDRIHLEEMQSLVLVARKAQP